MTDKIDEVLKKAKKLEEDARASRGKADAMTPEESAIRKSLQDIKEVNEAVKTTRKTYTNFKTALVGFYETAIKPAVDFLRPLWGRVAQGYNKWIWQKFAYKTDKATGERKLDKKRAGAVLTATFMAAAALTPTAIGGVVRTVTVDPVLRAAEEVVDAGRMAVSYHKDEVLYLNRDSQTSIDRNDGTYMVRGCKTEVCGPKDSIYFIIKDNVANSVWNAVQNGSLLYNTHKVAAAVPTGAVARCETTNYGGRWDIMLYLGVKPVLVEATCSTNLKTSFNLPAKGDSAAPQQQVSVPAASVAVPHAPSAFRFS